MTTDNQEASDHVAFLLDRLAEDEARWQMLSTTTSMYSIAAFLLAECEAKRWIVLAAAKQLELSDDDSSHDERIQGEAAFARVVLSRLVLSYADYPDFREEWRP